MGKLKLPPSRLPPATHRIRYTPREASGPPPVQSSAPWRAWYKTKRWRDLRLTIFARDLYRCQMCGQIEGDTSKLVCDHRRPHRGDERLFWSEANLQTICKSPCHDKHKQALEQESLHHLGVWD